MLFCILISVVCAVICSVGVVAIFIKPIVDGLYTHMAELAELVRKSINL